ncbi:MAG TPA: hypothetical protein VHY37_01870 [Tepidisphaeraceae bacterium]|nr:hypothetical protein [Tepidisphaeraceae bacterium]
MAIAVTNVGSGREMSGATALRYSWISYIVLLFVPFLVFIGMIWSALNSTAPSNETVSWDWFIGSMAYLALVVPAAIFWRSHVFKSYWKGVPVAPSAYFGGMLTVWIALEVGGILSLVGCMASNSMMPCLIPAAVAFVLFTPLWPSGRAMIDNKGMSDDPEKYAEPH